MSEYVIRFLVGRRRRIGVLYGRRRAEAEELRRPVGAARLSRSPGIAIYQHGAA